MRAFFRRLFRRLSRRRRRAWQCFCYRLRSMSQRRRCRSCCPPRINTACALHFRDQNGEHHLLAQGFFLGTVHSGSQVFPGSRTFDLQRLIGPAGDVAAFLERDRCREVGIEVCVADVRLLDIVWFTCTGIGLCIAVKDFTICENIQGYVEVRGFEGLNSIVLG